MTFALTAEQLEIREAVARLCDRFGDDYWLKKDTEGGFPAEFHGAMAEAGWLGVAMPGHSRESLWGTCHVGGHRFAWFEPPDQLSWTARYSLPEMQNRQEVIAPRARGCCAARTARPPSSCCRKSRDRQTKGNQGILIATQPGPLRLMREATRL